MNGFTGGRAWLRCLLLSVLGVYMLLDAYMGLSAGRASKSIAAMIWYRALEPSAGFYLIGFAWGLWRWRPRGKSD